MKIKLISIIAALFLLVSVESAAQITFKTEYFGTSSYRDVHNQKVGDSKGSALTYQASASLPLSMKMNENHQPAIWGIGLAGAYVSLDNKNFTEHLVLSEIMNLQISLFHARPLSRKWSMMASVGIGIYTDDTRFSHLRLRNLLGSASLVFVRRMLPSLELGGGLALNNAFGYPMLFPALYVNWHYGRRLTFNFSAMDGVNLSAGYNVSKAFSASLVAEMGGQMAMAACGGDEKVFTHQYIVAGLRPEFKISKHLSVPITIGVNAMRAAYFDARSLSALFKSIGRENDPCFQFSPYVSAGIIIQL